MSLKSLRGSGGRERVRVSERGRGIRGEDEQCGVAEKEVSKPVEIG